MSGHTYTDRTFPLLKVCAAYGSRSVILIESREQVMSSLQQGATVRATPATFVNLRTFAQDHSLGIPFTDASEENDFLFRRRMLDLPPGPVTVGVITLDGGRGSVKAQPADELIIVREGKLTLTQPDRTVVLGPGNSAVLLHDAEFVWSAECAVSIIFMRYNYSRPGARALLPIAEEPALEPSGAPSAALLLTPTPACRNYTDYRSQDGQFVCGTWDSTPYHRRAMLYPHYELMYLLEGSVTFEDETGRSGTFSRGDIFLVEQNAQCSWDSREQVTKVYGIFRPA
ncbi:cupin domain-containing protein [Cupriavidus sp. IDO]|uniref:cupin domain-containing protein n=1 Tax=Cupriavidus sp. IDO TaxID=1539142 RepID=UPI001EE6D6B2|nr:cupin domain-containing protein [Cupriavidus sp. IDO]